MHTRNRKGFPAVQMLLFGLGRIVKGCDEKLAAGDDAELRGFRGRAQASLDRIGKAADRKSAAVAELKNAMYDLDNAFFEVSERYDEHCGYLRSRFGRRSAELANFGIRPKGTTAPRAPKGAEKLAGPR